MHYARRWLLWCALAGLSGCAGLLPADPQVRATLAPSGTLQVGVYPGSPTSMVRDPVSGEKLGVAYSLGQQLGRRLGVPVQVVEFERLAQVLDALKTGSIDFTFTNATEARARDIDFTPPLLQLELGYLVPPGSALQSLDEIDRPGMRVGVAQGSSSQGALARRFTSAVVVPAASLQQARDMLAQGQLDAFATNKGILFEIADQLPGARVLDGRWGLENMAIAIPKGREAGLPYLRQFAQDASGQLLPYIVSRAGLRGTSPAP